MLRSGNREPGYAIIAVAQDFDSEAVVLLEEERNP
jgi:hypothetical protein